MFAPKRVLGAGFVAGVFGLPNKLVALVLVMGLVLTGVALFEAGVGSVALLLPNKVVAGAVVAVVAAEGFVVAIFAVSAGFPGWVTPNKLGPFVLDVCPNKLAAG